ncbi:MAG: hypothetical protein GYB52_08100 [Rhodospirillales bacterium]|nr:hypothetical protein [Rhodospirillales bacterium]MBR9816581.1 hypothetical protein [Rhodospirillales bacterium]
MDIYENVVIGGFIYALGFRAGQKAFSMPTNINLLQQTPMDKSLADVLIGMPDVYYLLEFKRRANKGTKEAQKLAFLQRYLSQDNPRYLEVSRGTHLYIESELNGEHLATRCSPYLDFQSELKSVRLERIVDVLLEGTLVRDRGITGEECCHYLGLVQQAYKAVDGVEGDTGTSGGFIIVGGTTSGTLKFVTLPDIRQFTMTREKLEKLQHEQVLQRENVMSRTRSRSQGIERDRGHSIGF